MRELGIITTITLPPWDRFREEEKGEERMKNKTKKKKKMVEMVVANEEGEKGGKGNRDVPTVGISRIITVAVRNDIRSLLFRRL